LFVRGSEYCVVTSYLSVWLFEEKAIEVTLRGRLATNTYS